MRPSKEAGGDRLPHEERQQQIVEMARRIITDQGMEHLTMRALAEEMNVTEAALYRHVRSKQDVILLLLQEIESVLLGAIAKAERHEGTALEKLYMVLKTHVSHAERRKGVSFLVIAEAPSLGDAQVCERVSLLVGRYLATVDRLLGEGQEQGMVHPEVDTGVAARVFFGVVQSNVILWALDHRRYALADSVEGLWAFFLRALSPVPLPGQHQLQTREGQGLSRTL
ncbi:MAG: TetR/AcrR family transcriptional regulator [Chloroflexi bacterium]|nr:TetR/AcrR family transcriptional regulator [Chloroflexota bacterium]